MGITNKQSIEPRIMYGIMQCVKCKFGIAFVTF